MLDIAKPRRGFLAGLAALPLVGGSVALVGRPRVAAEAAACPPAVAASAHPDAALLALRKPFERTLAGANAVSPAHSAAEEAYYAAKDANPGLDRETLKKMTGLDVAEARWQAALDLNCAVILQIIETPARTIEGLIFKAEICERESMHGDLAESIVTDLVALGGLDG